MSKNDRELIEDFCRRVDAIKDIAFRLVADMNKIPLEDMAALHGDAEWARWYARAYCKAGTVKICLSDLSTYLRKVSDNYGK